MKKIYYKMLLPVFASCLLSNTVFAQGAYVNVNAGYAFGSSTQTLNDLGFYNYSAGNNTFTIEQINVSLGKGLNFGGAFGYMFNKNIGAELGVNYLLGGKSEANETGPSGSTTYTLSSKMIRIIPSLVIASGFEKLNPYAKFGMVIGSGSILFGYTENSNGDVDVMKMKLNGGVALGLTSAIGAKFSMSDKMSFFGELNMVNLSYAPTKGEFTESTSNGVDLMPDMTTNEKEVEFVDSYTYTMNNQPPDSQPSQELKIKFPYGSVGLNIGLIINF